MGVRWTHTLAQVASAWHLPGKLLARHCGKFFTHDLKALIEGFELRPHIVQLLLGLLLIWGVCFASCLCPPVDAQSSFVVGRALFIFAK
jgi:hypothetical protein